MYLNIRGLKSKFDSLLTKVDEIEPAVICITETHLLETEPCVIDGYGEPYRNDKDNMGGGLIVFVRKEIENICTVVEKNNEVGQSLWVVIDNNQVKIRLGLIYAPQESRTKKAKLKIMYEHIKEQVQRAEEKQQNVLLLGDFNCKIGDEIKGNRPDVTKGGKLLLKLVERNRLSILNKSDLCQGMWTRTDDKTKSVIDYVMVDEGSEKAFKEMIIDENREFAPSTSEEEMFSDHNVMVAKFDWVFVEKMREKERIKTINTEKGYAQAAQEMETEKISSILEQDEDLQSCYDKWKEAVELIEERNKSRVKKKNPRKAIKMLVREKKHIKIKMKKSTAEQRVQLKSRLKAIDKEIKEESSCQFKDKIMKVVEKLRSAGGINGANTWEVLKRLKRKNGNPPTAIKDKDGTLLESKDEILSRYLEHFVDILKPPEAATEEEQYQEEIISTIFDNIAGKARSSSGAAITRMDEIEKAISELKKKKCQDEWGWKNEIIITGKDEMKRSLMNLFNRMEKEKVTPSQWNEVLINTIPKKGSCLEMDNKRGLFLTEVVSKVYEKVIKNRNKKNIKDYISDLQTGGVTGRATVDNKIILSEVFRRNRKIGRKTYVVFGDAVKCFDKLWLKDALVELSKAGCLPQDIMMIHEMNKDTVISVKTPVGKTNKVKIGEIVKQGTVLGPTLCCIETDQINKIGEDQTRCLGDEIIGILIFVDDVMSAGIASDARKCIRNLREMEVIKKFTYGLKKTLYMVVNTGREEEEEINEEVKGGKVKKCSQYEYLGFWVNEEGNCQLQIEKRGKKIMGELEAIKSLASYHNVGPSYLNVRLHLFENCVIPSLLYDLEGWNKLSKKEIKMLESIQLKALCSLIGLPKSTPYFGLLNEIGIWSIEERMKYRKIMLYHNLINSSDKRLAKRLILQQKKDEEEDTFYDTVKKMAETLNIDIKEVDTMTKAVLKQNIKKKIGERMVSVVKQLKMKKLRFIKDPETFGRKKYVELMDSRTVIEILKIRLNMTEIYGNYKGNLTLERLCPLCQSEEDTTEHLLTCKEVYQNEMNATHLLNDNDPELWRQIIELVSFNMEKRNLIEPGKKRMRHRQKQQNSIKKNQNLKNNKNNRTVDAMSCPVVVHGELKV